MSDGREPATPVFFLDEDTRTLFRKTKNLLDQILETFDILEDQALMEKIREGEEDIKEGKTVTLEDYKVLAR
ncbi:MAG: hypothetical protein ACTSP4_13050 [Candidatus Hodarchaeales archaeon]